MGGVQNSCTNSQNSKIFALRAITFPKFQYIFKIPGPLDWRILYPLGPLNNERPLSREKRKGGIKREKRKGGRKKEKRKGERGLEREKKMLREGGRMEGEE